MGRLLWFPDCGMWHAAVEHQLTFEEIADQWNLIPGVLPVRFSDVEPGRGIHKAVMTILAKHRDMEWWVDLFTAVHESDGEKDDTSLADVLKELQGPSKGLQRSEPCQD